MPSEPSTPSLLVTARRCRQSFPQNLSPSRGYTPPDKPGGGLASSLYIHTCILQLRILDCFYTHLGPALPLRESTEAVPHEPPKKHHHHHHYCTPNLVIDFAPRGLSSYFVFRANRSPATTRIGDLSFGSRLSDERYCRSHQSQR